MTKFMLTNAPKIREFHAWDSSTIQDLPSFLAAFDASALEHCTIRDTVRRYPRLPFPGSRSLPLFSGGGDRLRSLCLTDIHDLPGKAFPALTLLLIAFVKMDVVVRWNMEDLLTLLAGSTRLEEVYVHNMWFSLKNLPPRSAGFAQVSLPRLRHLAFTYRPESGHAEAINPPDYLLTRISCIPSTCHMTFTAAGSGGSESTKRAIDLLDSVRRRVHGKDAVSHAFLRLFAGSTTMQLVFSQGSLHLHLPAPAGAPARPGTLKPLDVFAVFADLFSRTEELRVHYNDDSVASALSASLPAACPHLRAMSLIRDFDWDRQWPAGPPDAQPTLHAALKHLAPPLALACGAGAGTGAVDGTIPYPALDTLWVSLERPDEIAQLEADLAARASLGFPVNCVIVTVHARGAGRPDLGVTVARLRALNAGEVIVMEIGEGTAGGSSALREVDWMVRLPERFALPPAVHRDWPVGWHDRKY